MAHIARQMCRFLPLPRPPPMRSSGYTACSGPAEPVGRIRRQLLRAGVAALAMTRRCSR
jgi:hypothetical protein